MPELSLRFILSPCRTSVLHAGFWNLVLGPFDELTRTLHFAGHVPIHWSSDRRGRP